LVVVIFGFSSASQVIGYVSSGTLNPTIPEQFPQQPTLVDSALTGAPVYVGPLGSWTCNWKLW